MFKITVTIATAFLVIFLFCAFTLFPRPVQAQNTVTATINVGEYPHGIAVSPNGEYLYVTNSGTARGIGENGTDTVSVINTANNTVTATITGLTNPDAVAVTPNGEYVYVANPTLNTVSVISTVNNTVTANINVGVNPGGVAVTPNGEYVYVTNEGNTPDFETTPPSGGSLSVISTTTNTVTATLPVGPGAVGVAFTPNGKFAYVTNAESSTVSVINTATYNVTANITVGEGTDGVAVTPNGKYVYVTNEDNGSVSVISTATNNVTATIAGIAYPRGVAITPNGEYVYVTGDAPSPSLGYGVVSVISTTTNTVTSNITVGSSPFGVTITPNGEYTYIACSNYAGLVNVIGIPTPTPAVPELVFPIAFLTLAVATCPFILVKAAKLKSKKPKTNITRKCSV